MTDQPETELEYHFRKLSRKIIGVAMLVCSALFLIASGITASYDPGVATCFVFGSVMMLVVVHATNTDGRVRALMNLLPGDDLEDLQRPNERSQEVPADD